MKLYLIVPFFAPSVTIEKQRIREFREWRTEVLQPAIEENYKDAKIEYLVAATDQVDRIGEGIYIKYDGVTPKGLMVRGKLLSVFKEPIDTEGYLILIDGSGKIVYDAVREVLEALTKGKHVVLGCRPKGYGISEERKAIEMFENFLLEEKYGVVLPDAQCGCWGVRVSNLKDIPLTANSYEIELDLVSSSIEHSLCISYVPVEIKVDQSPVTNFKYEANKTKLKFLSNKLGFDNYILKAVYNKFQDIYKTPLPPDYVDYIDTLKSPQDKNKYICKGGCGYSCEKVHN
ncbi:MAG: hypothetical protein HQK99_01655 [Nitrospirae bacterium]|nr:hypothetical protein [Nitrospirota bacterium]